MTERREKHKLRDVKIATSLLEELLSTINNVDVLVKCVLEKLEDLEDETKCTGMSKFMDDLIKDTRQLMFIIDQEKTNGYQSVNELLAQVGM